MAPKRDLLTECSTAQALMQERHPMQRSVLTNISLGCDIAFSLFIAWGWRYMPNA